MSTKKRTEKPAAAGNLYTEQAVGLVLSELFGLADPDEVLRRAGLNRSALRKLEGDDEIAGALETRLSSTLAAPWRLDPYDATIAPFIEAELQPLIEAAMSGAWSAAPYGYSVLEAVYVQRDAGRIGLLELTEKPFEWFRPKRDGGLFYLSPANPSGELVDQSFKFFLTRRRATYRNPFGEAILSRAYWPWFMRNAGWRAWARFLERSAGPLLLGKTSGDTGAMAKALAEAALSGAVAVGTQDSVDSVAPPNVGQAFDLFAGAVDRRIQKLILGQTLTTDVGKSGGGSLALGKVHAQVKDDRVASDHRMLQRTFQRVVDALVALNFPSAKPPTFVLGQERGLSTDRATRDKMLVDAGIVKLTEQYLLDRYDFERGDFEIPEAPPQLRQPPVNDDATEPPPVKKGAKASAQFAAGAPARFTAGQQAIEDAVETAVDLAGDPVDPKLIRAAIRASTSADDLVERLAALFAEQPQDAYRELMARALFAADVMGYAHAEAGD